jgi:hypothetical protein
MELKPIRIHSLDQIDCVFLRQRAMTLLRQQYNGELPETKMIEAQLNGVIAEVCRECPSMAPGCLFYNPDKDVLSVQRGQGCPPSTKPSLIPEPQERKI